MRPQSAKAKGRRLQQKVAYDIQTTFDLSEDDVRSTSMGANGEDVLLSATARERFPFSLECKNTERINIWESWSQTKSNAKTHTPALVIHKNNSETLCVLRWETFLDLVRPTPPSVTTHSTTTTRNEASNDVTAVSADANDVTIESEQVEHPTLPLTPIRLEEINSHSDMATMLRQIAARLESCAQGRE